MFETFSYLPPLTDGEIARQVDYMVNNRQVPCLEFAPADLAYSSNANTVRMGAVSCVSGPLPLCCCCCCLLLLCCCDC